ncbi:MAG: ATP-binding cassette domain-containing protein [Nitriliruptorales bacterium]|nr:ATP-binding cassette domain-containing protein [Nitriliruptorales bacterium]
MSLIAVEGVSHWFPQPDKGEDLHVLDGIDLSIEEGEFVAIVGPSGCGKSTLLNMVAGFVQAIEGTVLCRGEPVVGPSRERGLVFQELAILPWRTVRRNIAHGLELVKVPKAEREERVSSLIHQVGLAGFDHHYPHQLSGGMRQRVAVARTWAADPAIILMDEPFGAVDAMTRLTLQEQLNDLCVKSSRTVLFITHSVDEAVFLADRVVVMTRRPGKIKETLTVDVARQRRDWDYFNSDRLLTGLVDQALKLVREERIEQEYGQARVGVSGSL